MPWLVMGYFNIVMNSNERMGGAFPSTLAMDELGACIQSEGLIDCGYEGNNFTWCNGHQGGSRMWQRLDRMFVNSEWNAKFHKSLVMHLARGSSDHCPLLLMIEVIDSQQRISYFKFLDMWAEDPSFLSLVAAN